MKFLSLLLKILTFPVWGPVWLSFWLLRKGWRLLLILLFVDAIGGCGGMSNKIEKSPCACDFRPLNTQGFSQETQGAAPIQGAPGV